MLSTERRFAIPFATGLAVAGSLALWRGHTAAATVLYVFSGSAAIIAATAPRLLSPVKTVVEAIVRLVGLIIGRTVLLAFYWCIFTPFALVLRLLGKDSLKRRAPAWQDVPDADNDPESLRRLF